MVISRHVRKGNGNVNIIVRHSNNRAIFASVRLDGYPMSTSAGVWAPNVRYANIPIARLACSAKAILLVDTLRHTFMFRIGVGRLSYAKLTVW